jgi:predicted phage replisome organizer
MAKYDKDTKFYWLLLKEDFFDDDAIDWLESQKPNGRDYAYFYLKLCLKSLKTNGILIRNVGNMLIPYDNKKLSEMTKMDFDTVTIAMELLKKIGLIKILDNGEIYLTQLENLIGSKSLGAFKKQQQRLLRGQEVDKCPPKIELELKLKDKDRDKDIVISKTTTIYEYIENNFGRTLSSIEVEKIDDWLLSYDEEIIKYAIEISTLNNKRTFNYVNGILRNWKTAGYKTLQEIKDNELPKHRKLSEEEQKEIEEIFDYDWLNEGNDGEENEDD